ncbi:hypothetical protein TNCV_1597011 [Trichonephila clavipes]|nr:hypothetical protein TNCV_1597011 [Trichonephila clavipes]
MIYSKYAVFAFSSPTDRKCAPINAFSLSVTGRNSMLRDLVSMVDARAQYCVCPPRTVLQRANMHRGVVLVQNPLVVALQILPFLPHSSSKLSQDLNVILCDTAVFPFSLAAPIQV